MTSWRELSLYLALAKNCCVPLAAIVGLRGLTSTEVRVGAVIASVAVPVLPSDAAAMVTEPAATTVASPEF